MVFVLLAFGLPTNPLGLGSVQAAQSEIEQLHAEIEVLKSDQQAMRREIAEIKQLLQRPRAKPRSFKPLGLRIDESPYRGELDAPVTLVEFVDYQCPYCQQYADEILPEVLKAYVDTGKLRYVVRELPIVRIHPLAFKAAEAARCSGVQGMYWEMHDVLFSNPDRLGQEDLIDHAEQLGLDLGRFSQCLDAGEQAKVVREDLKAGRLAGVRGTPTFFLGLTQMDNPGVLEATRVIRGAQPFSAFQEALDSLLGVGPVD
jgi:protein-disulfide isomerase